MQKWFYSFVFAVALAITPAAAANKVSAVELEIVPEQLTKFLDALNENGAATIKEPGCVRYDVVQSATNPNTIMIFEVYADDAAVALHRATPHFKKYQEVTKDMVAKRQSRPMNMVSSFTK